MKNIRQESASFFTRLSELRIASLTIGNTLVFVLAMSLLLLRGKIDARLQSINKMVGRVREDSILFTLQALLLNLVRFMPVPLLLLLIANGLQSPDSDTAPYLAKGLEQSIKILLLLMLVRTSCLEFGIARTHFAWPKEYCENLQRLSTRLLLWWFPLVVITAFIFQVELNSISAVLGRLLFCLDTIVFTFLLISFLAFESTSLKNRRHLRFWLLALTLISGIYFIWCSISGYIYSSQVVFGMVINSLAVIIVLIIFYEIMRRWLLVVRRRLRFNEMLAARQAPKEGEVQELEYDEINLVSLSESVSSLLKIGTITINAFLLFFIWAPLFRALEVGIAYGSDVRKAVAILQDLLDNHELIAAEPEPDVIFNKFDNSALNLTARYFFTDVQQRGFLLSDLHLKINDAFAEAGIVIAFPQVDVHFDRGTGAESFPEVAPTTT